MIILKTYLYNFDPLKPHFYVVKLGFTGVYIIFHISAQKHTLLVLVRVNISSLVVKFSIYLNRRVFVMFCPDSKTNYLDILFHCIFFFYLLSTFNPRKKCKTFCIILSDDFSPGINE